MNVLITSASRKVSLVRAFQRAVVSEGGGKVIAVDASALAPALYLADACSLVPPTYKPGFIPRIIEICKQWDVSLIIPTRDEELLLFSLHKSEFSVLGIYVHVPDPHAVQVCQDKCQFVKWCKNNGFVVPKTYDQLSCIHPDDYPLFVRPQVGKGGLGAYKVGSQEELNLIVKDMPQLIIQEYIQATEYTVDLFANLKGEVISVVPRERMRVFGGESFVGKTCYNKKIIRESTAMARKLGLTGHNTIQCFLPDDGSVMFIEVNPRYGGGAHLGFAAGIPTPLYLVQLLKGRKVEPKIGQFKSDLLMLRYTEDYFIEAQALPDRVTE